MDGNISRRRVLAGLGAAGITGLAGCASGDGTPEPTDGGGDSTEQNGTVTAGGSVSGSVKIGVLQPVSGDLKYYGQQALWGFYQGFDYKGEGGFTPPAETGTHTATVGDVDYELVVRDTQLSADQAQTLATDLVQNEGVDMLFGCTSSASATRVIKTVSTQANIPTLIGPAASASITANAETCSDVVFRTSENTAMDARSGGKYVAENTDVEKVYLFGADYSFGRAVVNNYKTVLRANGVEIVGEKFVPRGYSEWDGLLDNAAAAGAGGIVAGFTVATLPQLFTTYLNGGYDFSVFGGFATQITTSIIGQTLQKVLGEPLTREKLQNAGLGPFTSRYHWNQYDNPINDAFVESYTNAYGIVPDLFTSGTFAASSAIVQSVEASGSTEGADIAAAMRGMTIAETPKGEDAYTFQRYNNQARSAMTIADVVPSDEKNWNAAIMPSEPLARIGKDQTTIPADSDEMGCSL
ncbi:ABC transporter substrate-binding protein [Natronomonas sp. EA1]|uniref:ABC transporter substrate-binding protein n=1 Tax=Natronomonas sp. EA1 TaxID=3421655 RepID=UPI003EB8D4D3